MRIIAKIDGNCLCLAREDFINLQESPVMFIKLTKKQLKEYEKLEGN